MKTTSITLELLFLTALIACLLGGIWLTVFDLGMKPKYERAIMMALAVIGCAAVAFFIVHLVSFYPAA